MGLSDQMKKELEARRESGRVPRYCRKVKVVGGNDIQVHVPAGSCYARLSLDIDGKPQTLLSKLEIQDLVDCLEALLQEPYLRYI